MGLTQVINTCIAFMVFVMIWTILSITILPHMANKIGITSLPPFWLWRAIYAVWCKFCEYAVIVIGVLFIVAYIIYRIINGLPGILKMMIGWMWSPFIAFYESGVFPLFDAIVDAVFSTQGIDQRFDGVVRGIEGLLTNGFIFIVNDLIALGLFPTATPYNTPPTYPVPPQTPSSGPSPISNKVQASLDQQYNECLQQKLINITDKMTAIQLQQANAQNQAALVSCKLGQLYGSMNIMAQRSGAQLASKAKG